MPDFSFCPSEKSSGNETRGVSALTLRVPGRFMISVAP